MSLELAIFYGFLTGLPLIVGAVITQFYDFGHRTIGLIMAFGSGVLMAVVAFSLMTEAYHLGGIIPVSVGLVAGAVLFTFGNSFINKRGAKNRRRCTGSEIGGGSASGMALALGSLMDNIPESFAIGVSLFSGGTVSSALLVGIMISNFPESSAGAQAMKKTGRSRKYILKTWGIIAVINVVASAIGFSVISQLGNDVISMALGIAGGAILAMLAETMMPEAFENGGHHISLATVAGFLVAFILSLDNL